MRAISRNPRKTASGRKNNVFGAGGKINWRTNEVVLEEVALFPLPHSSLSNILKEITCPCAKWIMNVSIGKATSAESHMSLPTSISWAYWWAARKPSVKCRAHSGKEYRIVSARGGIVSSSSSTSGSRAFTRVIDGPSASEEEGREAEAVVDKESVWEEDEGRICDNSPDGRISTYSVFFARVPEGDLDEDGNNSASRSAASSKRVFALGFEVASPVYSGARARGMEDGSNVESVAEEVDAAAAAARRCLRFCGADILIEGRCR